MKDLEETRKFYSRNVERQDEEYDREEFSERFRELRDLFLSRTGDGKVLDAGCGPGMDTDYFTQEGFDAVGVDVAEGALEYARENKEGEFRQMDIRDLDFRDGFFDGVWCSSSIFFLPPADMDDAIAEFSRVLSGDGVLYINFKIGEGEKVREKWGGQTRRYQIGVDEARGKLERHDFRIIESEDEEPQENHGFAAFIASAVER